MRFAKLVVTIFYQEIFLESKIFQAIIITPTIGMNSASKRDTPSDYSLQRVFWAVGDYLAVPRPLTLEQAKNNRFSSCPGRSDALDTACLKTAFISPYFIAHRRSAAKYLAPRPHWPRDSGLSCSFSTSLFLLSGARQINGEKPMIFPDSYL